jgi:hypothetical protein
MNGADALDFGRASVATVIRIRFYSSPTSLRSAPGEIARQRAARSAGTDAVEDEHHVRAN